MIEYATLSDLREFGNQLLKEERASLIERVTKREPGGSTFLSHSSLDAEFLPGVIKLLEDHGGRVYIDKKDKSLPPYTSRETAKILRRKITASSKFILFATNNSKDSRWIPWELGIADGLKHSQGAAILPGVDKASDTSWTNQEYLGIYDRIVWGDLEGHSKKVWMVLDQVKNVGTELSVWLKAG